LVINGYSSSSQTLKIFLVISNPDTRLPYS
ncbi:unnamed protein product, partial [marine sediment metagenome]